MVSILRKQFIKIRTGSQWTLRRMPSGGGMEWTPRMIRELDNISDRFFKIMCVYILSSSRNRGKITHTQKKFIKTKSKYEAEQ